MLGSGLGTDASILTLESEGFYVNYKISSIVDPEYPETRYQMFNMKNNPKKKIASYIMKNLVTSNHKYTYYHCSTDIEDNNYIQLQKNKNINKNIQ